MLLNATTIQLKTTHVLTLHCHWAMEVSSLTVVPPGPELLPATPLSLRPPRASTNNLGRQKIPLLSKEARKMTQTVSKHLSTF